MSMLRIRSPWLRADGPEELLRRPLSPLRDEPLLGREQVRAVLDVQGIGVRPSLVHPLPRIRPVVVDLAPEQMPSDPPHVLVLAELPEVLVAHEDVVDVLDLEGQVVEPRALVPDAEEHVVVDVFPAAVAAIEGSDDVVLAPRVDVVRADEAEVLAEPLRRLLHVGDGHDPVTDPLHSRAALGQPHQGARPLQRILAEIEGLAPHGDGGKPLDPVDHLDLVAVRLSQPDALAAAGSSMDSTGEAPGALASCLRSSRLAA